MSESEAAGQARPPFLRVHNGSNQSSWPCAATPPSGPPPQLAGLFNLISDICSTVVSRTGHACGRNGMGQHSPEFGEGRFFLVLQGICGANQMGAHTKRMTAA